MYKCKSTYYTLFLCLQMQHEQAEHKKQVDEENISLNNQSRISPTGDEKMKHVHRSSDNNSSSGECQSI